MLWPPTQYSTEENQGGEKIKEQGNWLIPTFETFGPIQLRWWLQYQATQKHLLNILSLTSPRSTRGLLIISLNRTFFLSLDVPSIQMSRKTQLISILVDHLDMNQDTWLTRVSLLFLTNCWSMDTYGTRRSDGCSMPSTPRRKGDPERRVQSQGGKRGRRSCADIFQPTDLQLCDWSISGLLSMS